MSFSTLRPIELAVATLVSATVLLIAVAPALVATPPAATPLGGLTDANPPGIEWVSPATPRAV